MPLSGSPTECGPDDRRWLVFYWDLDCITGGGVKCSRVFRDALGGWGQASNACAYTLDEASVHAGRWNADQGPYQAITAIDGAAAKRFPLRAFMIPVHEVEEVEEV